jgi:cytochrome b561
MKARKSNPLRNTRNSYGLVAVLLHWGLALLIIGLFFLGEYMVDLDYYDPWYNKAPDLHRSLGVIAAGLMIYRFIWSATNLRPAEIGQAWERRTATLVHQAFYLLIAAIVVSGYLITTADGQGVPVFNWFEIPAAFDGIENQEDIAGAVHEWLAYILIVLVVLHALAALKHHFINHDATLRRMFGKADS